MDGDQPREGVIRKAESLDEEVELSSPPGVLHGVVQLPPAQHVDVALPKEGICKKRMVSFPKLQWLFQAYLVCVEGGTTVPLSRSFSAFGCRYNFIWQKYLKTRVKGLAVLQSWTRRVGERCLSLFLDGTVIEKMFSWSFCPCNPL